jgi:hypothetical protein
VAAVLSAVLLRARAGATAAGVHESAEEEPELLAEAA